MGFVIRRKPNDIVYVDYDPRLVNNGQGVAKTVSNVDAVMASIDNILGTMQGERVMLPSFASTLRGVVFENLDDDTMEYVSDQIKRTIETWDKRVTVLQTEIRKDPDRGFLQVTIVFQITLYQDTFTFTKTYETE